MNKTDEDLLESCKTKLKEILDAPHVAKVNLMQTDGKLIINYLNFYKTLRQAESGKEQARAVIAKMICESKKDAAEFFKNNLPEIAISTKQLSEKK